MTEALLPDVEKALIQGLLDDTDLAALIDTRVRGDLLGPFPMLRVQRTGGTALHRADRPLLFVDAYGDVPDKRAAGERERLGLIARTALRAMWRLVGTTVAGCQFTALDLVTVGQWLPDPVTLQGRNHNVVRLTASSPRT